MRYISTRASQKNTTHSFCDVVLEGLAPCGGLYIPQAYPHIQSSLADFLPLNYAQLAYQVLQHFCDDIPPEDLRTLCDKTYQSSIFKYARPDENAQDIVPIRRMYAPNIAAPSVHLMGLSNGPTLAFKDMAMQFLGNLFEYILNKKNQKMTIIGATSGDTGSAAEYAMRSKKNLNVFMLSPHNKMSPFQQAQMYHLQDANIHNITIDGFFHHCQDLIKEVSQDAHFKKTYHISTVNSINWARIAAQTVYYVHAYLSLVRQNVIALGDAVDVCVPSGNFGNLYAAYVSKRMGIPFAQLICATNENDVLDEFFRTGVYRPRSDAQTTQTSSPSMDIAKASNLERLVFDLYEQNPEKTQTHFQVAQFDIKQDQKAWQALQDLGFKSTLSSHAQRLYHIQAVYQHAGCMIDPHTADGFAGAVQHAQNRPMLIAETAQPCKFEHTMVEALGQKPERHPDFIGIENAPKRWHKLPDGAAQTLKDYIALHIHIKT